MDGHGIICHMPVTCDVCSREFTPARADARYCSGKCRTQAYRRRAAPDQKPRRRSPLPEAIHRGTYDLWKIADRLERLAQDDRLPRAVKTDLVQSDARRIRQAANQLLTIADRLAP